MATYKGVEAKYLEQRQSIFEAAVLRPDFQYG